jgi:hypothetical protein
MCSAPKVKAPPPPAERQAMQVPKDTASALPGRKYRRGFWSAIMTSPQGVSGAPNTTGTPGA